MPQQTPLPSSMRPPRPASFSGLSPELSADTEPPARATIPASRPIPRWLVRTELFLRVVLRLYIGLAICYAPWSHTLWDRNMLFLQFPTLDVIVRTGAVRGLVSGLGLLNLWIAFQEALQREDG